MAKETIAPIGYVPYIILYINGKPFMRYNGPHANNEIRRFIIEVSNKVQNKQKFSTENNITKPEKGIPEYCTGHPISGDINSRICYLEFEKAYSK